MCRIPTYITVRAQKVSCSIPEQPGLLGVADSPVCLVCRCFLFFGIWHLENEKCYQVRQRCTGSLFSFCAWLFEELLCLSPICTGSFFPSEGDCLRSSITLTDKLIPGTSIPLVRRGTRSAFGCTIPWPIIRTVPVSNKKYCETRMNFRWFWAEDPGRSENIEKPLSPKLLRAKMSGDGQAGQGKTSSGQSRVSNRSFNTKTW